MMLLVIRKSLSRDTSARRLLHGQAHVVDVEGFIDLVPQAVAAPLEEDGQAPEQRLHFRPGHPGVQRVLTEGGDEQVQGAEGIVAAVAARLDAVRPVVGGEGVLGDTGLFQIVECAPGEGLRSGRAVGLGGREDVRDEVLGVLLQGEVTHPGSLP